MGADGGPVEEGWLPGDARVRELQTPASGSGGRRPGAAAHALPHAAIHRHRARRQPGEFSSDGGFEGYYDVTKDNQGCGEASQMVAIILLNEAVSRTVNWAGSGLPPDQHCCEPGWAATC